MDFIELFKRQLASQRNSASKSTIKNYIADINHFVTWYEKTMKSQFEANFVNSDVIKLYEKSMGGFVENGELKIESQLGVASMKRHLSSLRKFFSVLKDQNLVAESPFINIQPEVSITPTDYWHLRGFADFLLTNKASKVTVKNYISDIQSFAKWYEQAVLPTLDNPLVAAGGFYLITQSIVNDYKERLIQIQNAAPRTINRKLSVLRRYLDFAAKKGFINAAEISLDPIASSERKTILAEAPSLRLSDIDEIKKSKVRVFSPIPPIRLAQRLLIFPYLGFEEKAAGIIASIITGKPVDGIQKLPSKILGELNSKNLLRSQNTAVSTLLGVSNVSREFFEPKKISLLGQPLHKRLVFHARFTRPNWYNKYHDVAFVHYAHFALLIIFASGVGVALYQNLVVKKQTPTFAAATTPPRILSFQGRLTDNLDNPITSPQQVRFMIYNNSSSSGSANLWEEVRTVAPDQDGIFSVLLGSNTNGDNATTCGTFPLGSPATGECLIPTTVFSDNSQTWLGVTIGSTSELNPRQKIATVAYATNSEFLQGMPPTTQAGITSFTNVVLALDSSGNLTLADSSPTNHTFQVNNGAFKLAGQTLLLTTNSGTDGNAIISPDGFGKVDIQKGIVNTTSMGNITPGGVEIHDKFGVIATESAVAAFILNNNSAGGDIFTASSSGIPRFTVRNDGSLVNTFYSTAGGLIYAANSGTFSQTLAGINGQCLQSAGGGTPTWGSCGGTSYWNLLSGALAPINDTLDVLFGGQATSSAKFRFLNNNTGTPVASVSANSGNNASFIAGDGTFGTTNRQTLTLGNSSLYNTTGNILLNPNGIGRIGVFTSNPLASFDVRGISGTQTAASISANTISAALIVDNSGSGDILTASKAGQTFLRVTGNSGTWLGDNYDGELVVGKNGNGKITAAVVDPYVVVNQKTTGTTTLTLQTMGPSNADFIFLNQSTELSRLMQAGQLQLPIVGSGAGLSLGGDTQIYRGSADRIDVASGDSINVVSGAIQIAGTTVIDASRNASFNDITVTGSCTGCFGVNSSPFQIQQGAIVPTITSTDFLIGSMASISAKFAILNVNQGTPTASVSSGLNGTSAYFDALGNFQTTNNGTLTLGGSSTGNVVIDSNTGLIQLLDNTSLEGNLTVNGSGTHAFSGTLDPTNVAAFTLTGTISGGAQNITSIGDITANSTSNVITGFGTIGTNTTTAFQGLSINISGDATISGGDIIGAGGAVIDVGEANPGDITFNSNLVIPEDGFIGLSAISPRFVFDSTPSPDEIDLIGANFDLNNNLIVNIGNAATDFTSGGGLNIQGTLQLNTLTSNGGILYTNGSGQVAQATAGSSTQCLLGGTTPTFGSCIDPSLVSPFRIGNQGAIVPINLTLDTLLGGNSSASAAFKVTGQEIPNAGTLVGASASANTSFAALVTDNRGVGDLFTASSSGVTQFVIKNGGAVGIGTIFGNRPTAMLDVSGTASVSSQLAFRTGEGSIQTTAKNTLTIGGSTTGDIQFQPGATTNSLYLASSGNIGINTTAPSEKLAMAGGNFIHTASGNPTLKATLDTPGNAVGITVQGRYAYVADNTSGLRIIDITNPSAPVSVGSRGSIGNVQDVAVAGKYAYVATDNTGFQVMDVSDPLSPRLVSTLDTSGTAVALVVSGKYAYVADSASGLQIIDVSDPTNPEIIGNYNTAGTASDLYVVGKYAYVGDLASGLQIIDVSDPTNPKLIGNYNPGGNTRGVYVSGRYAYIGTDAPSLEVVDIKNPASPTQAGTVGTTASVIRVFVADGYAYVTEAGSGMQIINISTPASPTIVGGYDTTGSATDIVIAGKYGYVADSASGLQVIDINGIETPAIYAGSIGGSVLNINDSAYIGNSLTVRTGINVGEGGILSNGAISINSASGSANLIQGAPIGKALLSLNYTGGDQNIFTASSSGVTKFAIRYDGQIQVGSLASDPSTTNGAGSLYYNTTSQSLKFYNGTSWASIGGSGPFDSNTTNGTIFSIIHTMDFLLGSSSRATTSAQFAVLGLAAGTSPTASVSAIAGSNQGNGISLSGDGSIQSLRRNTLTIGGSTTGNIAFTPGGTTAGQGLVLASNGIIRIGQAYINNPGLLSAKFNVYSNLGTVPAASISANTSAPTLLINNDGVGDLLVASKAGETFLRLTGNGGNFGGSDYAGELIVGLNGTGKLSAGVNDPPYTIDGIKFATYAPSTFGLTEEYTGKAVLSYNSQEKGYAYKLDFNQFELHSDLWVFNRVIDPDITDVKVFMTPNSNAKTWYKKDGESRTITLFSDRPSEVSFRLTAFRFNHADYPTLRKSGPIGYVPPPPQTSGNGNNDNNIDADPFFDSLSINNQSGQWKLLDGNQNQISHVEAFSKVIIASIKAGSINAQQLIASSINAVSASFGSITASISNLGSATASSLAVTSNSVTIAGRSLNSYIESVIDQYLGDQLISPIAETPTVRTNVISPLTDTSAPSLGFQDSKVKVMSQNQTVAWFDNKGNASFSGTLTANNASISGSLAAASITTTDASVGGTLRANTIIAGNIQGLDEKIGTIAAAINRGNPIVATSSGQFSSVYANLVNAGTLTSDFGIFEQGITSMGPITATDVTAMDTLNVGNSLTITNNSINTIGSDLAFQSLRQGNITFQGGLIQMDTDGNMKIAGNLNVIGEIDAVHGVFSGTLTTPALAVGMISPLPGSDLTIRLTEDTASRSGKLRLTDSKGKEVLSITSKGDISASGTATFAKLNFSLVGEAQASSLTEATASGSAGFATLRSGQPELTIKNPNVTTKSLIYITPFGNTNNKVLYLLRQTPQTSDEDGSFTVGLSGTTAPQNIQFNWLIVN